MSELHNIIIVGSGPAGLTAAIYAARAGLKPIVIAGMEPGGQLMNTTTVENFPGFKDGISGPELMQNMMAQAQKFGAVLKNVNVTKLDIAADKVSIMAGEEALEAKAVILATGATPKRLGIPGENEYYGKGVSTCATCDGPLYRNKVVAVVGGGDAAMEEATFISKFASKVYILNRSETLRASKVMADRAKADPKIEIIYNISVTEVIGEGGYVTKLKTKKTDGEQGELAVDGMFLAIGHVPMTSYLPGYHVALDTLGYIDSADGVHTGAANVFVAGDVQDHVYRQAITAAGAGCRAALTAQKYLHDHGVAVEGSAW